MVGSAVETTVWSRAARNIPSIKALMMTSTRRWLRLAMGVPSANWGEVLVTVARCSRPCARARLRGTTVEALRRGWPGGERPFVDEAAGEVVDGGAGEPSEGAHTAVRAPVEGGDARRGDDRRRHQSGVRVVGGVLP